VTGSGSAGPSAMAGRSTVRVAVVGHVELVEFAVVERVPAPGEIVPALEPAFTEPGGGGAVASVQLRKLAGESLLLTSVGDDPLGERAARELRERHGVEVHAAVHPVPQRRGFTHLDAEHERTITVLGARHVPHGDDDLPWERLAGYDAVYFTGGDVGALRAARAARVLVATPRAIDVLAAAGVQLDVLVASASDPGERVAEGAIDPAPRHVVLTEGSTGGGWTGADGRTGRWAAAPLPGPPVDAYGCGDSFAAGLTYGLGAGRDLDGALEIAARCGAACLTGRGPYGAQLEG
jgi:ribokinase